MNKQFFRCVALAGALMLGACATSGTGGRIATDSDPAQNFSAYSKFAWADENPIMTVGDYVVPPLKQQEISDAIKANLIAQGFTYVDDLSQADFAVAYTVGAHDRTSTRTYTSYPRQFFAGRDTWLWGNRYFGPMAPLRPVMPVRETVTRNYAEGTLAIDIFDVARKSPVWHAAGSKKLSSKELRGQSDDSIATAVQSLLAGFPPQR